MILICHRPLYITLYIPLYLHRFYTVIVVVTGVSSVFWGGGKGYLPVSCGYSAGGIFTVVILFSWYLIERTSLENDTKNIFVLSILIIGGLIMPMLTSRLPVSKNDRLT